MSNRFELESVSMVNFAELIKVANAAKQLERAIYNFADELPKENGVRELVEAAVHVLCATKAVEYQQVKSVVRWLP